jgi:hypothetical protein
MSAEEKIQALLAAARVLLEQARQIAVDADLSFNFAGLSFSVYENQNLDTESWRGSNC